jgi:microcystin degradation protein MlrC
MMKIFVSLLVHESNTFNDSKTCLKDFNIVQGPKMLDHIHVTELLKSKGYELVPGTFASCSPSGTVDRDAYEEIKKMILTPLKEAGRLDGIWLFLHGAMTVEGVGSAEHDLLRKIRNIVGYDMPIAVAMDPHGNVSEEYVSMVNAICCYRTSPHVDIAETQQKAANMLIYMLENKKLLRPVYCKVPILLGGERCVSAEEPLYSINEKLDEYEKDDRILSACYHVGFAWGDRAQCCACVTAVPSDMSGLIYTAEAAKKMSEYAFSRRKDFSFTGEALSTEEAISKACADNRKPVFISDSGDNTTAGAKGTNTVLLSQFIKADLRGKKILITPIWDKEAVKLCAQVQPGEPITLHIGTEVDRHSQKVTVSGTLKTMGKLIGYGGRDYFEYGLTATISLDRGIDVMVGERGIAFTSPRQFQEANVSIDDYDIIVVKEGYLFDQLSKIAKRSILALTEGDTYQLTENLPYRQIPRPVFPVDNL